MAVAVNKLHFPLINNKKSHKGINIHKEGKVFTKKNAFKMEKNINKVRSKVIARYYEIKNFIIKLQICRARQYKYIFKKRGKH